MTRPLIKQYVFGSRNFKCPKDRIMLMATANVSRDFKLPLMFIYKSNKPRCFSGVNMSSLPVLYYGKKKKLDEHQIFFPTGFTSTLFLK